MNANARIRLETPSQKHLKAIKASLLPEVNRPGIQRAQAIMSTEGNSLILNVTANDTTALRSALNAYLRWIRSSMSSVEVLNQEL